jgi:hypothetical protein
VSQARSAAGSQAGLNSGATKALPTRAEPRAARSAEEKSGCWAELGGRSPFSARDWT